MTPSRQEGIIRKLIFISYSKHDLSFTEQLASDLSGVGYTVWFDPSLRAGDKWAEKIRKKISEATYVLVLISKHSLASPWVANEIAMASALGKDIIPLSLDNLDSSEIPYLLKDLNFFNFNSQDYKQKFALLKENLVPIVAEEELLYQYVEAFQKTGSLLDSSALKVIELKLDEIKITNEAKSLIEQSRKKLFERKFLLRGLTLTAMILFLASLIFAVLFGQKSLEYQSAAATAEAVSTQAIADRNLAQSYLSELVASQMASASSEQTNYDLALLLSIQSISSGYTHSGWQSLFNLFQTKPQLISFIDHGQINPEVAISPNGKFLVGANCVQPSNGPECELSRIRVWDSETMSLLREFNDQQGSVGVITFDPAGRRFAAVVNLPPSYKVVVWEFGANLTETFSVEFNAAQIKFSPDGKAIAAAGFDKTIAIWDVVTGNRIALLSGHSDFALALAFSPDGKMLATSSTDGEIKIWDLSNFKELAVLKGHGSQLNPITGLGRNVVNLAFNDDGSILASIGGDTLNLWAASTWELLQSQSVESGLNNVWFMSDGKLITTQGSKIILLDETLKFITGATTFLSSSPRALIRSADFNPNLNTLISSHINGQIVLWEPLKTERLRPLVIGAHKDWALTIALNSQRNIFATGGWDGQLKLWDVNTLSPIEIGESVGPHGSIQSIAFSSDGGLLAFATGHEIYVYELDDFTVLWKKEIEGQNLKIEVLFNPDGQTLVSATSQSSSGDLNASTQIEFWDAKVGSVKRSPLTENTSVWRFSISPDGRWLATGSQNFKAPQTGVTGIAIWDLNQVNPTPSYLPGTETMASSLQFSYLGDRLVSAGLEGLSVWDVNSRSQIVVAKIDRDGLSAPSAAQFTVDDMFIVTSECVIENSGCKDGVVTIRLASTLEIIGQFLFERQGALPDMILTQDDEMAIAVSQMGNLIFIPLQTSQWQNIACSIANRVFSKEEIEEYWLGLHLSNPACENTDQSFIDFEVPVPPK